MDISFLRYMLLQEKGNAWVRPKERSIKTSQEVDSVMWWIATFKALSLEDITVYLEEVDAVLWQSARFEALYLDIMQVTKTPVSSWGAGVKGGANYVRGVWTRLNGGGRRTDGLIDGLPEELQMPAVDKEARSAATKTLSLEIANLEKQLQESSKVHAPTSTVLFWATMSTALWSVSFSDCKADFPLNYGFQVSRGARNYWCYIL